VRGSGKQPVLRGSGKQFRVQESELIQIQESGNSSGRRDLGNKVPGIWKHLKRGDVEINLECRDLKQMKGAGIWEKILGQDLETGWRGLGQYKGPGSEKSSGCRDLNRVQRARV
jgi:hypothetical protein